MKVRSAEKADAAAIAELIARNLHEVNAKDDPAPVIDRLLDDVSSRVIARRIARWRVWVAVQNRAVVGTSALDGNTIRMMFVDPDRHRHGIGSALLAKARAAAHGHENLEVFASLSAVKFYTRHGFTKIGAFKDRQQRTIFMQMPLPPATGDPLSCGHNQS